MKKDQAKNRPFLAKLDTELSDCRKENHNIWLGKVLFLIVDFEQCSHCTAATAYSLELLQYPTACTSYNVNRVSGNHISGNRVLEKVDFQF